MKKKTIIGMLLPIFLAVIITTSASPALATPKTNNMTYWYYGSFGQAFLAPPGHPNMMIEVLDVKRGSFGPHDILMLYVWFEEIDGTPVNDFLPCKGVTDNAECADLMDAMFAGIPTYLGTKLIEDEELEVWRKGNKLSAHLTVEVSLAPTPFYIPPLCIEFQGSGGAMRDTETMSLPSGYTITMTYMGFNAFVTFVCHPWECPWPAGGFVALHGLITITGP